MSTIMDSRRISGSDDYRAATRRGVVPRGDSNDGVQCRSRMPAFITSDRDDFVTLVRAFTERNEPAPIPGSQGAAVVAGFNTWHRIRRFSPAPLSDGAFTVLQILTHRAARALERFESTRHDDPADPRMLAVGLVRLAMVTLDEMAGRDGYERLADAQREAERVVRWESFAEGASLGGLRR